MASGESFRSLAFQFRTHNSYISRIVHSTLAAIVKNLLAIAMPEPTEEMWRKNAHDFEVKWNYPNAIGAIDGKHIRIRCPRNTGSLCYNYKEFFSIVLLAIVDANYRFVAVDIGAYGREGDAGVFMRSDMGKRIKNGTFSIPPPKNLPNTNIELPHVIVGDEAFALDINMMKSYPRRAAHDDRTKLVYNYRHSRCRRVSENGFGILCSTWRVFFTPIHCSMKHMNNLVMATCILHNLLRSEPENVQESRQGEATMTPTANFIPVAANVQRSTAEAHRIRDEFKQYFNGTGRLEWQDEHIDGNF